MSFNTFGKLFRFSTWGESHGPAIGCVVDGCPPNISIKEQDIQIELDKRKPGQSKFTTQRKEDDKVQILSGVFEGKTTGTPISLIIYNKDMRSKDYGNIKDKFRPGHADLTYFKKGGFGSHVKNLLAEKGVFDKGLKFRAMTLPDLFIEQDSPKKMYDLAGLNSFQISKKILDVLFTKESIKVVKK